MIPKPNNMTGNLHSKCCSYSTSFLFINSWAASPVGSIYWTPVVSKCCATYQGNKNNKDSGQKEASGKTGTEKCNERSHRQLETWFTTFLQRQGRGWGFWLLAFASEEETDRWRVPPTDTQSSWSPNAPQILLPPSWPDSCQYPDIRRREAHGEDKKGTKELYDLCLLCSVLTPTSSPLSQRKGVKCVHSDTATWLRRICNDCSISLKSLGSHSSG